MQKNSSFFHHSPHDRGIALLFSLGILSALMLLGIAFMGSSIFSRRIAENRSNSSDAMILARSTANLVAAAVNSYRQVLNRNTGDIPFDYRAVFSVGDPSNAGSSQDEYGEFLRGYEFRGLQNNYSCGSTGADKRYFSKLDVHDYTPYHGNDSSAQWVYVRVDDDASDRGRIIGRYAYQVLPTLGYGRLNLARTLRGDHERMLRYPGENVAEGSTPETYDQRPRNARWGQSTAELNFAGSSILSNLQPATDDPPNEIPAYLEDLYAAGIVFGTGNSAAFNKIGRAWMAATFTEGSNPGFREVAPGNHYRFDLAAIRPATGGDDWLSHFENVTENSEALLEAMTQQVEWNSDTFAFNSELSPRPGLAFLRYIGNDRASFNSLPDLRHQISANFNDYCDSDDIPTSDITDTWTSSNAPTYTGNEKTLYINELLVGGSLGFKKEDTSLKLDSATLILGAELIDIYGGLSASGYRLVNATDGTAEVAVVPTFRVASYVYKEKEGTLDPVDKSGNNYLCDNLSETEMENCDDDAKPVREVKWSNIAGSEVSFNGIDSGYAFGAQTVAALEEENRKSWSYTGDKVKELVQEKLQNYLQGLPANTGKTISDVKITSDLQLTKVQVRLQAVNITLGTGGIALLNGTDNADYTRTTTIESASGDGKEYSSGENEFKYGFMIGGMEAKDPRQNLNVSSSDAERRHGVSGSSWLRSDWVWDPEFVVLTDNAKPVDVGTVTGNAAAGSLLTDMQNLTGRVNSEAAPNSAYAEEHDTETVSDPAWQGDTAHISTAVIRNAPMRSPWELGFIHRGVQFQTINLKAAIDSPDSISDWNASGTSYTEGDGGILDWIRMSDANYSDGKISLNQFGTEKTSGGLLDNQNRIRYCVMGNNDPFNTETASATSGANTASWENLDRELLTALFYDLPITSAAEFVNNGTSTGDRIPRENAVTMATSLYDALRNEVISGRKLEVRSDVLNLMDWSTLYANQNDDATREEIIGRTINLLTAKMEPPAVFRAVIVAQSIRDLGDENAIDVISSDHPSSTGEARLGIFNGDFGHSDPNDNIHYDVITGEAKILVTYEWNSATGQAVIRDIETIE